MWVGISVALILIDFQMEFYINYRQRNNIIAATKPPEIFADQWTTEEFTETKAYELDKATFKLINNAIEKVVALAAIFVIPFVWKITKTRSEVLHSIIFIFVLSALNTLSHCPTSYYSTFVIEEKHGFNKSTLQLWIMDKVKMTLVIAVIGSIVAPVLIFIYRKAGNKFIIYTGVAVLIFMVTIQALYPILIYPLFTKLTPLPDSELRSAVEALANRTNFPVHSIYTSDDSKRSSHQNAMVFGMFKKNVAVADTLLNTSTTQEIEAIVGHEIGHAKGHHIPKLLVLNQLTMMITVVLLHMIMKGRCLTELGIYGHPIIAGLAILMVLSGPVDMLVTPPVFSIVRSFEFEADAFPAKLGLPIDAALIRLAKENKMAIEPDRVYAAFTSTHPSIPKRVEAIRKIHAKVK